MELCDECINIQFYAKNILREIPFFVILNHFVSSYLHKSKSKKTRQPRVLYIIM